MRQRADESEDEIEGQQTKRMRRANSVNDRGDHIPSQVPISMRQAFIALTILCGQRTDEEIAVMKIPECEVHLEQLEKQWAEVEREWRNLYIPDQHEELLEIINREYAHHSELYLQMKVKLRTNSDSVKITSLSTPAEGSTVTFGTTGQTIQIQLPDPVQVPRFSGQDVDWARFRSSFIAEIHNNVRFNSSQKLRHLLNSIEGRARDILGNWTPDCGNYEEAWLSLCIAYDNEYNTVQAHLRKIDNLYQIHRPTCSSIRGILDTVRGAQRQLKVLLTTDQLVEHLLMHRIEGLLDIESLSQWSLRRLPAQLPTLSQLYEFLELRASTLLAIQGHSGQVIEQRSGTSKTSATWGRRDERRPECKLCIGERHMPFQCLKFKAMTQ